MRPVAHGPLDEEFRIEGDATLGLRVKLYHPAVDAIWIELRIDRAVERVGEIDPSAIAADLDHLRSAVERPVLGARMRCSRDDTPDAHFARHFRLGWVGDVVLLHVACSPTGNIEKAIVHRQIDVGYLGGTNLNPFSTGGRRSGSAGSAGMSMILLTAHLSPSRCHIQIDDDKSLRLMTLLT